MDNELLLALCLFWLSTTITLVSFSFMWFFNEGAAFHPHSVNLHNRHSMFMVVSSETECKDDFCVASISAYVAPRGSTTSKFFAMLNTAVSVSGILGSYRWYKMEGGGANYEETLLIICGFMCLFLVAGFELDVSPQRFLEDKLMITKWLIEKQVKANSRRYTKYSGHQGTKNLYLAAPFVLNDSNILAFIRESPLLYSLYSEDHHRLQGARNSLKSKYGKSEPDELAHIYGILHMIGAIGFVVLVTTSIIVHDTTETEVGFITGLSFIVFSLGGYLTGKYVWLLPQLRGVIMLWNPFLYEPQFMAKLQRSVNDWLVKQHSASSHITNRDTTTMDVNDDDASNTRSNSNGIPRKRRDTKASRSRSRTSKARTSQSNQDTMVVHTSQMQNQEPTFVVCSDEQLTYDDLQPNVNIPLNEVEICDDALDNFFLKLARYEPKRYLKLMGHIMVITEMIALLTPCVAVGIHWITALCTDATPTAVMLDLIGSFFIDCIWNLDPSCDLTKHCILRQK
jgi:hypothetical protein